MSELNLMGFPSPLLGGTTGSVLSKDKIAKLIAYDPVFDKTIVQFGSELHEKSKSVGLNPTTQEIIGSIIDAIAYLRAAADGRVDVLVSDRPTFAELNSDDSIVVPHRFRKCDAVEPPEEVVERTEEPESSAPLSFDTIDESDESYSASLDVVRRGLNDVHDASFDTAFGEVRGLYLCEPTDPYLSVREFIAYSRRVVRSIAKAPSDRRVIERVGGVFVNGSESLLVDTYRLFFDVDRNELCMAKLFNRSLHTNVYCTEECRVCPEFEFFHFRPIPVSPVPVFMTQAGPGCGKTHRLINMVRNCKDDSLVLTSNKATSVRIRNQLRDVKRAKVYTLDSYLMHKRSPATRVFIDELSLVHPGKILYAVTLSRCSYAHGFGDIMQIGYFDRLNLMSFKHADLRSLFPVVDEMAYSYRVPSEICHALTPFYKYAKLKPPISVSKLPRTFVTVLPTSRFRYNRLAKLLVFCQSDKSLFVDTNVSTVHEFQGDESDVVHLYCSKESRHLQNSQPHVIVALSRHKFKLMVFIDEEDTLLAKTARAATYYDESNRPVVGGATDLLSESVLLGWSLPKPYDFMSVSRTNSMSLPKEWERSNTVIIRPASTTDYPVYVGKHAIINVPSDSKYMYRDLPNYFLRRADYICGRKVLLSSAAFPNIEPHLVVRCLNRYSPICVKLCSKTSTVVSNEVHELCIANGLFSRPEADPILSDSFVVSNHAPDVSVPVISDKITVVQQFVSAYFTPGVAYGSNEFAEFDFHSSDQSFPLDNIKFNNSKGVFQRPIFDKLRPVLNTPVPRPQQDTNINAFHSILKRNANVPKLNTVEDRFAVASGMVDKLFSLCPGINKSCMNPSPETIQAWCDDQPLSVLSQLKCELAVFDSPVSWYSFQLKKSPKPDLTPNALKVYPAVQTILCQEKHYNALFCPVFRNLRDRIMSSLDRRIMFFTKVDDDEFSRMLTHRFPPSVAGKYNVAEFDMSKYDKSQGLLILLFECLLLERCGVSPLFARLWFLAHAFTTARNNNTGLSFKIWYQRKSGDASTYLGNTLVLMMSILDVVPLNKIGMLLCSGDDSLLWTTCNVQKIKFDIMSNRYNFEVKLFLFQYHYFCSKFLIAYEDRWYLVPDPLKRATKLGRHDLANFEHAEEYRVSLKDNVAVYGIYEVANQTAHALMERYKSSYFPLDAILALHQLAEKENFSELFYTLPDDVLCMDPSRPALEL